ncbi:MAG: hypothetical protein LBM04_11260 [Opitutaceae bacterium]|jgi:hypothetical protein|nr:hypothetical protein [Opitutaceae bacterium]
MTMQQLFEYDIVSNAGAKNTIWNELDRLLQNEIYERIFKEEVEFVMEKLGIFITLNSGMEDFHKELETAIMLNGLENVVIKVKELESSGGILIVGQKELSKMYSFSCHEDQCHIRIEHVIRYKRAIATLVLFIHKNIDGKLISCSVAIEDNHPQANH